MNHLDLVKLTSLMERISGKPDMMVGLLIWNCRNHLFCNRARNDEILWTSWEGFTFQRL